LDERTRIRNKIDNFQPYIFSRCNQSEVKVACILDTFSYECFKYEAAFEQLRPDSWKEQMDLFKPHFLFVESAWRGVNNSWWGALFNRGNRVLPSQKEFFDLILYCRRKKIKTVFWNKEDPINYHYFIGTAKLFDTILTTDEGCVNRYVQDVGLNRVFVLPFAAQPIIHNPVNSTLSNKERVAFAGTWYTANHPERERDMRVVLTPAKVFGLHIFDRMNAFTENANFRFPEEFQTAIMGELNYADMLKAYKLYQVFLNVNSVKNSPTMFSRRVFEILASGANLVSTYSKGMEDMFGNQVCFSSTQEETKNHLRNLLGNPEYSQRLSKVGMRTVFAQHTYRHRFNTILEKVGMKGLVQTPPGISIIICMRGGQPLRNILESYQKQTWRTKELLLVVEPNEVTKEWKEIVASSLDVRFYEIPENPVSGVGDFLNHVISQAKYKYIAIQNERDDYAPNYLLDLMNAFEYTDADIVGKSCYYVCSEKGQNLILKNYNQENAFTKDLSDSAFIVRREVFYRVKFSSVSEDIFQAFIVQSANEGLKIFSADKYNFIHKVRGAETVESKDQLIGNVKDYKLFYEKFIKL
jgi:spore maturation protein CgeB